MFGSVKEEEYDASPTWRIVEEETIAEKLRRTARADEDDFSRFVARQVEEGRLCEFSSSLSELEFKQLARHVRDIRKIERSVVVFTERFPDKTSFAVEKCAEVDNIVAKLPIVVRSLEQQANIEAELATIRQSLLSKTKESFFNTAEAAQDARFFRFQLVGN